jgi:hypothetical protein
MVGDVLVDSETSVATSSISRSAGLSRFFEGVHKGRICMHACIHRGECALIFVSVTSVTKSEKKT